MQATDSEWRGCLQTGCEGGWRYRATPGGELSPCCFPIPQGKVIDRNLMLCQF